MSSEKGPNIFMPKKINYITIIINSKASVKIKTEKITTKRSEKYFFHQRCEETVTNTVMASRF